MDAPMARNLINAGFDVALCDVQPEVTAEFGREGTKSSHRPPRP